MASNLEFDLTPYGIETYGLDTSEFSKNSDRKSQHLAGRVCAKNALGRLSPPVFLENDQLPRNSNGAPMWPSGIVGSITHTSRFALAAVTRSSVYQGLGVDIEEFLSESKAIRLKQRLLLPEEEELFHNVHERLELKFEQWVTLIFSAKESIFKCLNPITQTFIGFHDAAITSAIIEDGKQGLITFNLKKAFRPDFPSGFCGRGVFQIDSEKVTTAIFVP